ncbi:hypothetical protein ABBQ38_003654 [Trebouxia sp. C0009 RCD-2024]
MLSLLPMPVTLDTARCICAEDTEICSVKDEIEVKQGLAVAEYAHNALLLSLNSQLLSLQEKENIQLRSQTPSVPVPTAMPTINIQVTPEMLANIQLPTHADNQRSYAASKTNYEQAKEAANRMGWTLHSPKMYDVPSSGQVPTFEWPDKEDDSGSKLLVQQALEAQMHLPDNVSIVTIERQIVCFETERQNKCFTLLSEAPEFEVYIEDLNHAVARALSPHLVREPDITEMHAIPPELASLYMDPHAR